MVGRNPKPCAHYGKDGNIDAVADSVHELAELLGITASAVSHGLHRGDDRYMLIDDEVDE